MIGEEQNCLRVCKKNVGKLAEDEWANTSGTCALIPATQSIQ